jgi:hypothetical protein
MSHRVYTFVPGYGQHITATTFLSTHAIGQALQAKGIGFGISTLSFPDIAELRDMALTIWFDRLVDCSHLLFIDADMGIPPDLILDMLLFNEPIVGSIYPQRQLPTSWAGSGTGETLAERRSDFMKVEGVGMGCCLIRRDAIPPMIARFPDLIDGRLDLHPAKGIMQSAGATRLLRFFDKMDIPTRGVVSEDLSFCIRHNMCGGQVWAAIGHKISHVGPFDYGHRYLDMTANTIVQVPRMPPEAEVKPLAPALPISLPQPAPALVEEIKPVLSGDVGVLRPEVAEFLRVAEETKPNGREKVRVVRTNQRVSRPAKPKSSQRAAR